MRDNQIFVTGLKDLDIELTKEQLQQFEDYYELLIEWNKVMNLTAITEYNEVIIKHFVDSLSLVKIEDVSHETYKKLISDKKLLDLGTGAGFPGIPLKIAFPELDIVLLDSLKKRIRFLDEVINRLNLKKICAIHGRAEEVSRKEEFREKYDFCVSRAVARLVTLSEYCIPFVKKGGFFVSYKSGKVEEELLEAEYAIRQLGGKCAGKISFELPGTNMERSLVLIRKCLETPVKYPRAGGKPNSKPLINYGVK
ncbi:MAG: 16S rRNA (guanine(527)-N(7))-methyltransferase RsmG [Lachnospiraceae bacterium]|nr:16S rRNA (guanine(527)-N(7))-methyltransferase RsmG [Lachnospiraceae bacterium]